MVRRIEYCGHDDATGYHYVTEGDEITEITVSDSSENAKKRIDEYAVKNDTQVLYYSYNGHFYKQLTYERYMIQPRKNINMLYMQMLMKRFLLKKLM